MPARTTTERGYGAAHQAEKARWQPTIDQGEARCAEPICLMPSRVIQPGPDWDLAHDRVNGGYLGPAHPKCNRTEGATYRQHGQQRTANGTPSDAW
jgi:hypothetical protein